MLSAKDAAEPSSAGSNHNLRGYAWSGNIGWLSFNCLNESTCSSADYGVNIDPSTGIFSGYAWSPVIGYVSFNVSDTATCPGGGGQARVNIANGFVSGWARALAGDRVNPGVWDGCINLRGSTPVNYGVSVLVDSLRGYAWGGENIGWLSFSGTSPINYGPIATVPIAAVPSPAGSINVSPGTGSTYDDVAVVVSWDVDPTTAQANSCEVRRGGPGYNATLGSDLPLDDSLNDFLSHPADLDELTYVSYRVWCKDLLGVLRGATGGVGYAFNPPPGVYLREFFADKRNFVSQGGEVKLKWDMSYTPSSYDCVLEDDDPDTPLPVAGAANPPKPQEYQFSPATREGLYAFKIVPINKRTTFTLSCAEEPGESLKVTVSPFVIEEI